MAATTYSNPTISIALPRVSAFRKPLKALHLKIPSSSAAPQVPLLCKFNPPLRFPLSLRSSFKSFVASDDSQPLTSGGEEHGQSDEGKASWMHKLDLKTLVEAYKKALFDNNEKAASEIETMLYMIESKRNELIRKVADLSADIMTEKERCMRLQADFENFRKQSEKEQVRLSFNAQEDVIGSLLAVVDYFEKAKQQSRPETEKGRKIDASYQGIYKQFVEIMRSLNVSVVETVGKPFDPLFHEAVAREESHQFKEGIVIQETRRGFLLRDRVLRPSMVKISKGPGRKEEASVTKEEAIEQPTAAVD